MVIVGSCWAAGRGSGFLPSPSSVGAAAAEFGAFIGNQSHTCLCSAQWTEGVRAGAGCFPQAVPLIRGPSPFQATMLFLVTGSQRTAPRTGACCSRPGHWSWGGGWLWTPWRQPSSTRSSQSLHWVTALGPAEHISV